MFHLLWKARVIRTIRETPGTILILLKAFLSTIFSLAWTICYVSGNNIPIIYNNIIIFMKIKFWAVYIRALRCQYESRRKRMRKHSINFWKGTSTEMCGGCEGVAYSRHKSRRIASRIEEQLELPDNRPKRGHGKAIATTWTGSSKFHQVESLVRGKWSFIVERSIRESNGPKGCRYIGTTVDSIMFHGHLIHPPSVMEKRESL